MKNTVLALIGICLCTVSSAQDVVADEDIPLKVINVTASNLQQEMGGRQDYYAKNLPELYGVVDRVLLPSFDVEYSGKQVLGRKHWTEASVVQREAFIAAFYNFLVRTYAKAILEFDQDRMKVLPSHTYSKDRRKVLVKTQLSLQDGSEILVAYALRKNEESWRIYDVRVDGVSYIQNYRSQFDAEISALGLDAVIERLEKESQDLMPETTETTETTETA